MTINDVLDCLGRLDRAFAADDGVAANFAWLHFAVAAVRVHF